MLLLLLIQELSPGERDRRHWLMPTDYQYGLVLMWTPLALGKEGKGAKG